MFLRFIKTFVAFKNRNTKFYAKKPTNKKTLKNFEKIGKNRIKKVKQVIKRLGNREQRKVEY